MPTNFPVSVDSLVNPLSTDPQNAPSHSAQHANANDAIEAIEGYILNGTGAAWQTWAPTLSGGWANGNGSYTAVYSQIGKTVNAFIAFTVGSTTTKGTGMTMSLPVTAASNRVNSMFMVRAGVAGSPQTLSGRFVSTTTFEIEALGVAGTYLGQGTQITSTIPATWATGNTMNMLFTYEAA